MASPLRFDIVSQAVGHPALSIQLVVGGHHPRAHDSGSQRSDAKFLQIQTVQIKSFRQRNMFAVVICYAKDLEGWNFVIANTVEQQV